MKEGEKLQNKEKINGVFGIHHVTAITSDPNINIQFYSNILGLRFVKLTVNQDDTSPHTIFIMEMNLDVPVHVLLSFIGQNYLKDIAEQARLEQLRFLFQKIQ